MAPDRAQPRTAPRPRVYCTYFDRNYLARGLALWRSLRRVSPDAVLWICCLDDATLQILERLALAGVRLFSLAELERRFPDLAAVRPTRSRVEYYFTCTPSVIRFVLDAAPEVGQVTYLDADLYFFADPERLFHELEAGNGSVGIIAHRFPERLKDREQYGIYNVGWLTFSRDESGEACLEDWRRNCIAWCYARAEGGKFADQKYLDSWPGKVARVVVLRHEGANVALWNLDCATVAERGRNVTINGEPLLFYHFHGLSPLNGWLFRVSLRDYDARLSSEVQRLIYRPYLRVWRETLALSAALGAGQRSGGKSKPSRDAILHGVVQYLKDHVRRMLGRERGEYLVIWPSPVTHVQAHGQATHAKAVRAPHIECERPPPS